VRATARTIDLTVTTPNYVTADFFDKLDTGHTFGVFDSFRTTVKEGTSHFNRPNRQTC
jgi:hypothetical protein